MAGEVFDRVQAWISGRSVSTPLPQPDARLALGVLLVRVAKADRAYLFEELEQIDRIIAHQNNVDPLQAAKTRAMCEKLDSAVSSTATFVELIKRSVAYADRLAMVEALWNVVVADGIEQKQELELVTWIEDHIGVERRDADAAHAKARAAKGLS